VRELMFDCGSPLLDLENILFLYSAFGRTENLTSSVTNQRITH
jgi:hypothetical protein